MQDTDSIYREELMEHYRNPSNRGSLANPTLTITEKNPMCGDVLTLQATVSDDTIMDIKFDGEACAVCIAAASVLTDEVKGKTLKAAKEFDKDKLLEALGVNLTTSRIKCATLSLEALAEMTKIYENR